MKRDKGLRDIIINIIEDADTDDLIRLGVIFITILMIIAATVTVAFVCHERHKCIDAVMQQYPNASVEELKQRIELCNI